MQKSVEKAIEEITYRSKTFPAIGRSAGQSDRL